MPDALERRLRELGPDVGFPAAPMLAASVGEDLRRARAEGRRAPRPILISRRRLIAAIAIAILLLGGAALAAKLAIGAITVKIVPTLSTPTPTARESGPVLGEPATLDEARREVTFRIQTPAVLGNPDRAFLDPCLRRDHVVLAWRSDPSLPRIEETPWGAVVFEFRGNKELSLKEVRPAGFRAVMVDGRPGFWIHGFHLLTLQSSCGQHEFGVTGNVLIWKHAGLTLRLETELSLHDSVALAETFA